MADSRHLSLKTNPFLYSSEYTDSESRLQYLKARYYDEDSLCFTSRDSVRLMNRYNYANGNPVTYEDPSGHITVPNWANTLLSVGQMVSGVGALGASIWKTKGIMNEAEGLGNATNIFGKGTPVPAYLKLLPAAALFGFLSPLFSILANSAQNEETQKTYGYLSVATGLTAIGLSTLAGYSMLKYANRLQEANSYAKISQQMISSN